MPPDHRRSADAGADVRSRPQASPAAVPAGGPRPTARAVPRDLPPPLTLKRLPAPPRFAAVATPAPGDIGVKSDDERPSWFRPPHRRRSGSPWIERTCDSNRPTDTVRGPGAFHFTSSSVPHSDGSSANGKSPLTLRNWSPSSCVPDGVVRPEPGVLLRVVPGQHGRPAGTPPAGTRPSPAGTGTARRPGRRAGRPARARLIFVWANAGSSLSGPPPAARKVELVAVPAGPVAGPGVPGVDPQRQPVGPPRPVDVPRGGWSFPFTVHLDAEPEFVPGEPDVGEVRLRRRGRRSCSAGPPPAGRRGGRRRRPGHVLDVRARVGDADEEPVRDDRRHGGTPSGVSGTRHSGSGRRA